MNTHIVKVQLPLATSEGRPVMLIYTRDRRFEILIPVSEAMAMELRAYPHKGYFELNFDPLLGEFVFGARLGDLGW